MSDRARLLLSGVIALSGWAALSHDASAAPADDPAITAVSRDLTADYTWGFFSGFKQQHGSYQNGRSLHAVLKRTGSGERGYPDYLLWFNELTGQTIIRTRAVAYPTLGINPATHAVFASDASAEESGRFWWVMGGRADSQPFDLYRSVEPFKPLVLEQVLDNFVTEPGSTTPALAIVGETGLLPYRWRASGSPNDQVRFRNYAFSESAPPLLRFEKSLGRGSNVVDLGDITIEQLWSRWDPRRRAFALTWQWFQHTATTPNGSAQGSNPFLYTDDFGTTWKAADGSHVALPLDFLSATASTVITPYEHFSRGEHTTPKPRDIGFTPGGAAWITLVTGPVWGTLDGWQLTLFRWDGTSWQAIPLVDDMEATADAIACGPARDYLVCAYSQLGAPGRLLVKASRDDGLTWSAPVTVGDVGLADNGAVQRINWVSFAQPAERYLDNTARFFLSYYRVGDVDGRDFYNRLRWVRVRVGPLADFNGDGTADDADLAEFTSAHAARESRADFNDDGVVDAVDYDVFVAALAGIEPGLPPGPAPVTVPDVVGLTQQEASTAIMTAGLVVGSMTQQSSATVPAGSVISQNPLAAMSVEAGSDVNLVVSNGFASGPEFTLSPASLSFGDQPLNLASPSKTIILSNVGTVALPILSIAKTGANPGQFVATNDCGLSVPAGGNCSISVSFKPTGTGSKSAAITVTAGDGAGTKTVLLTGTGVRAQMSVTPGSISFGSVRRGTTSSASIVTVSNTGTVLLPISSVSLGGTNSGQFARVNNCPSQVAAGQSCTVSVVFKPTSRGSKTATLKITAGGGAGSKTVTLSGTGT
jgi:hypothetical protein